MSLTPMHWEPVQLPVLLTLQNGTEPRKAEGPELSPGSSSRLRWRLLLEVLSLKGLQAGLEITMILLLSLLLGFRCAQTLLDQNPL